MTTGVNEGHTFQFRRAAAQIGLWYIIKVKFPTIRWDSLHMIHHYTSAVILVLRLR